MAKLESYSDLAKLQEDLVKKNFSFAQDLALSVYGRSPNFTVKSSFKQHSDASKKNPTSGYTYFEYKSPVFTVRQDIGSNTLYKTSVEYIPENFKQFKAKVELESNPELDTSKKTVSGQYTHEKLKAKLAVTDSLALKLSAVTGVNNAGGGIELTYENEKSRVTGYNAALWLYRNDYRAVLKHVSTDKKSYSLGSLIASLYYSSNPNLKLGGAVTFNKKELGIQGAAQFTLQEDRILKVRANEKGVLGLALRTKLTPSVTIVTATQFGLLDTDNSLQFGFRLKLNQ
jgi:Eukaryotic porin